MVSAAGREKILLHLEGHKGYKRKREVPYRICQAGIAKKVELSQTRVSRLLQDLIDKDYIEEDKKSVIGLERKRKVYFLSKKGMERAKELGDKYREKKVSIKTERGLKETKLAHIGEHIQNDEPLLTALNRIDEEGLIDLTLPEKEKEDIFVGRDEVLEELREELDRIQNGNDSVVFIKGGAGIGKTRLVNEFKDDIVQRDMEFLSGKSYYDSSEPYLPIKEAFRKYLEKHKHEEDKEYTGLLALGAPSDPSVEDPTKVFDSKKQATFYESMEEVKKIASEQGLVIFLDDVQWADKASLELFHYMSSNLRDSPVLFIAAYRPEEISGGHTLKEIKRRMSRERLFREIELDPLTKEDTKEIIQRVIGKRSVPKEFISLLHDKSDGNPLFILECVEQMLEDDKIDPSNDVYPTSEDDVSIPSIINDLMDRRIERLDRETKRVLKIGAVIGDEIPFSLLVRCLDMDEISILDHIDILTGVDIWMEEPDREVFTFTHGLVRLSVLEDIPEIMNKRLHQKVADEIQTLFEHELDDHYIELADHLERAERWGKAVRYYFKAGKQAREVYAYEDALNIFDNALNLVEKSEEEMDIDRCQILEEIGDIHKITGEYEKSTDCFETIKEESEDEEQKRRMYRKLGETWMEKGRYEKALDLINDGIAQDEGTDLEGCKQLEIKGWILFQQGKYEEAEKVFKEEREKSSEIGESDEIGKALHDLGTIVIPVSGYEDEVRYLEEKIDVQKQMQDSEELIEPLETIDINDPQDDIWDKAFDYYEKSLMLKKKVQNGAQEEDPFLNFGVVYGDKELLDKALEYFNKALDVRIELEEKKGIGVLLNNIGVIHHKKRNLEKAEEFYKRSLELWKDIDRKGRVGEALNKLGCIELERGEVEKAKEHFSEALRICKNLDKEETIRSHLGMTRVHLNMGKEEDAKEHVDEAVELQEETSASDLLVDCKKVLGRYYRERELYGKAEMILKKGLETADSMENDGESGVLAYELGVLFRDKGSDEEAKDWLEKARTSAEKSQNQLLLEKAKDEMDGLDV